VSDATIATRGLTRRFGAVLAVDDLSFEVPRGAVTGFLGPNGAGKTTTLRLILGLMRPDAGEVLLFGRPLAADPVGLLRKVGALVERPSLYEHLTGRQNVEIARRLTGVPAKRVEECLGLVGLLEAADRPSGKYSLGMKQRLGLALALLQRPELLILDEPTNGLDPAGIKEMRALLGQLAREEGVTILVSSHLLAEVEQMASHLVILRRGRTVFQGPLEELKGVEEGFFRVGVDRPEEAAKELAGAGWAVLSRTVLPRAEEGFLRIRGQGKEEAARLGAHLVSSGFLLHHLSEERPRLEASFLDLMGETADGEEVS